MSIICYYLCSERKSECTFSIVTFIKKPHTDAILLVYILYVAQMYNIFLLLFFAIIQQIKCTFICSFYWSIRLSILKSLHNSWNAIIENTIKPVLYAINTPVSYIKSTLKKSIWKTTRPCAPNARDFFLNVYHSLYRKNR